MRRIVGPMYGNVRTALTCSRQYTGSQDCNVILSSSSSSSQLAMAPLNRCSAAPYNRTVYTIQFKQIKKTSKFSVGDRNYHVNLCSGCKPVIMANRKSTVSKTHYDENGVTVSPETVMCCAKNRHCNNNIS